MSLEFKIFKNNAWVLLKPIPLSFIMDDTECIVNDNIFLKYGEGHTLNEAIDDYEKSIIGYYELLEDYAGGHHGTKVAFAQMKEYLGRIEQ